MMASPSIKTSDRSRPRLIIFDFDGTLAETEIVASEVISAKLAAEGVQVHPDEITATLSGVERDDQQRHLERLVGVSLPKNFMETAAAEIQLAASGTLSATPGAIELLQWLSIPFCVASNTSRFELIHRMRAANLLGLVGSRFFSSDDIGVRKPDPSVLLLAAEIMGVSARECLVVEDSVIGLSAARNANMRYCAFGGARHHTSRLRNDLRTFEPEALLLNLAELKGLLCPM
ncbi:MAG: HAD family phosphatase [Mesorhizobium sp.]|uniref:HAD family hydrolase n=1 Tax=Mesorhizobium sp. TaxID=1871066 RepID=UPI000FE87BB0|nr:HAD family phosphatase [Mesorhizobium sp.]RWD23175.1 MAG: HAD family phosphatase [Mesorhizobium sp.]TIL23775.1 MAG: HAD family phosphatase [Mesorhizobium sp.]